MVKVNFSDKIKIVVLSVSWYLCWSGEPFIGQVYRYCMTAVMLVEILMPQEGLLSQIVSRLTGHTSFPLKLRSLPQVSAH